MTRSKVKVMEVRKLQKKSISTNIACYARAARSPVFYGSSRISGRFSRLPFETNTGDTFSSILTSLNFVAVVQIY